MTKPDPISRSAFEGYRDYGHTGPGTLMGRYLRMFWHPILVAKDLPAGRARPVTIMSEQFTLYRGQNGTPHLVASHCPHRLAPLFVGWVEGDNLHCRYHGWGFDGVGQCVSQPAEPKPFCERISIQTYPVREYGGLLFAYLGEGEAPTFPRYPEMEAPDVIARAAENYFECNYFNALENDPAHVPFTHRGMSGAGVYDIPLRIDYPETCWGFAAELIYPNGEKRIQQFGMPNISHNSGGFHGDPELGIWTEYFSWKVPIDDDRGVQFISFLAHVPERHRESYLRDMERKRAVAEGAPPKKRMSALAAAYEVLAGRIYLDDIGPDDVDPPGGGGLIFVQDHVTQMGQGRVEDRLGRERLGHADRFVVLKRQQISEDLRALDEGRPLKSWIYDPARCPIAPIGESARIAKAG